MKAVAILTTGVVLAMGVAAEAGAARSEGRSSPQVLGRRMMRNFEAELNEAFKNMFNFGSMTTPSSTSSAKTTTITPPPSNPTQPSASAPQATTPITSDTPPLRSRLRGWFRR